MSRVLQKLTNLFALWTVIGGVWAWYFPAHFTWFVSGKVPIGDETVGYIDLGLGVIMLGMGITLTVQDFVRVLKMPASVGIGVLAQFLIMPFLGWGVAYLFRLPDEFKLGLILVSCCPGGTASNVIAFLSRANVPLSVLMTMASTLLAVVMTPFLTKAYASQILDVDATSMIISMVAVVLVPVLGGVVINRFFGRYLSGIKDAAPLVSVIIIVLIVGGIIGAKKDDIAEHGATLLVAVFVVHALGFGLGYGFAKLLKMPVTFRRTLSIEVGMQNSGLGAQLATTHFQAMPGAVTPCAISAFYHCLIGSFLAALWRARPVRDEDSSAALAEETAESVLPATEG